MPHAPVVCVWVFTASVAGCRLLAAGGSKGPVDVGVDMEKKLGGRRGSACSRARDRDRGPVDLNGRRDGERWSG